MENTTGKTETGIGIGIEVEMIEVEDSRDRGVEIYRWMCKVV